MTMLRGLNVTFFLVGSVLAGMAPVSCGSSSSGQPGGGAVTVTPGAAQTIYGIVSDIGTGARLAGATVSAGGQTAMTDAQGTFTLAGVPAGSVNVAIGVEGYAPSYAESKSSDTAQAVLVNMKKQGAEQSYDATSARTLSEKTEAGPYALTLSPDSIDSSDPNLQVAITPLDPTKERDALPGSLVSGGSTPSLLIPVTFAEFTLKDSSGKRVNLKPSASAQVELPIPPSLRADYPDGTKIHCYAYDATTAKWEDFVEGTVQTSTVDGTSPVLAASIRHFSWYGGAPQGNNCIDVYVSVVSLIDGKPLANARVEATPGTVAYTDASGIALVRSAVGSTSSTYSAYQTGIDVNGSLTGTAGAKYIEFGKVQEDLAGLVQKPCTGDPGPTAGQPSVVGSQSMPLVLKIGRLTGLLYEATAILSANQGTTPGSVTVILQQGVPGPDGQLQDPMPAGGAKITLTEGTGTPVALQELSVGTATGYYSGPSTLTISAGKSYTLSIDADGNGSVDGTSTIFAVGDLAWTTPTDGATVSGANLVASWTDSGSAVGGSRYAPVYEMIMSQTTGSDGAIYIGTDRQYPVKSVLGQAGTGALMPGAYSGSLIGFSGAFSATMGGSVTTSNNIVGAGVTGMFYSFSETQNEIMFNVQ
jgi:hypothetical protein